MAGREVGDETKALKAMSKPAMVRQDSCLSCETSCAGSGSAKASCSKMWSGNVRTLYSALVRLF